MRINTNSVRLAYASVRRLVAHVFFDRPAGIETATVVRLDDLGLAARNRQDYHASPWLLLKRLFQQHNIREDDVFIDFGCGKGRVLIEAAMHPFRKVIGVELSPALADIARANVQQSLPKLRCKDVDVVTADVLDYDVPDDLTYIYFFDPFHGEIFSAVVEKLLASVRRRSRELTIIYFDPAEERMLLDAGARLVQASGGLRPTREWALENSVHVYKLGTRTPEPASVS